MSADFARRSDLTKSSGSRLLTRSAPDD